MRILSGDKLLAELIIEDMKLYNSVVESYDFRTEQTHIDLMAAVNNFHKVEDDIRKDRLI